MLRHGLRWDPFLNKYILFGSYAAALMSLSVENYLLFRYENNMGAGDKPKFEAVEETTTTTRTLKVYDPQSVRFKVEKEPKTFSSGEGRLLKIFKFTFILAIVLSALAIVVEIFWSEKFPKKSFLKPASAEIKSPAVQKAFESRKGSNPSPRERDQVIIDKVRKGLREGEYGK